MIFPEKCMPNYAAWGETSISMHRLVYKVDNIENISQKYIEVLGACANLLDL